MASKPETTDDNAAGHASPHLDEKERDQASAHSSPQALVIHEIIREEGETALQRKPLALLWSALAAGLSMGFSFLTQAVLKSKASVGAEGASLIAPAGYCVGFVIVVLGRQQLFTESTLTVVLPVLTRKDIRTTAAALRLWVIVLTANLAGTWIFAAILASPSSFTHTLAPALDELAQASLGSSLVSTALKAVLAGWLIALMVWLLPSARSAAVLIVAMLTYVVAVCELSHIIAGSVEAAYVVLRGNAAIQDYLLRFFVPTLLGNVIGGIALVGLLNHASIAPEMTGGH
ncbi:formate/nitrite transporter family protein [Paraburkholderia phymatum]|uniref:Putative transport protein, YfdC-like protein n=1 Tax=Paraburkholderia phymatum (strain DSM 17167 / CIP 108236 / LMG 21445 / STM815) TaxID=391038 RepID=B2JRW0_PARP8|nr:formate/nitrite transporter family protein [Paraburkholderia phymatum]ACC73879.1 putative transport protein, YfdC-like protein [Paraburkholderia phymatum STM815]